MSVHCSIDQLNRPTAFQRTMEFKTYFATKLVAIGPCFRLSPVENEVEQSNCYGRDSKGLHSKSWRFMCFNLKKKGLIFKKQPGHDRFLYGRLYFTTFSQILIGLLRSRDVVVFRCGGTTSPQCPSEENAHMASPRPFFSVNQRVQHSGFLHLVGLSCFVTKIYHILIFIPYMQISDQCLRSLLN